MRRLNIVNRRPRYNGPSYSSQTEVKRAEPAEFPDVDTTMIRADSTEYTADSNGDA